MTHGDIELDPRCIKKMMKYAVHRMKLTASANLPRRGLGVRPGLSVVVGVSLSRRSNWQTAPTESGIPSCVLFNLLGVNVGIQTKNASRMLEEIFRISVFHNTVPYLASENILGVRGTVQRPNICGTSKGTRSR